MQQMLAEAVLLTAIGAAIGVALAWAGVRELLALAPANLPRLSTITLDSTVLAFTVTISLAAAAFFGLTPAWGAFALDVMSALRGSSRTAGLSRGGALRNIVVVAEVALCFVLLIGSGLMFRSFLELQRINPGYDPAHLLTFQMLGGRQGPPAQRGEHPPDSRTPARDSRRAKRDRVVPVPACRGLQHDPVGYRRRTGRQQ